MSFTPDGKRFLSWGEDFYLRVWDVATGKALLEHAIRPSGVKVTDENAEVRDPFDLDVRLRAGEAALSPDGTTFVLSAGSDYYVFDVATGRELRKIPIESGMVIAMAVSPDGKFLAASAWSKGVETKLPDGRTRFSAANDHTIGLWDLSSGKRVRQVMLPDGGVGPVAFSADGKVLAAAVQKPSHVIRRWDVASGEELPAVEGVPSRVMSMTFSPDGRRLITGMQDTTALVWDLDAFERPK
jgi:WD40 repeat protein